MRRAFTLVELLASMVLTLILVGALFAFTSYFWINHVNSTQQLRFDRECAVFFDWIHLQTRNARNVLDDGRSLTFVRFDGSSVTLETKDGQDPTFSGQPFFDAATTCSWSLDNEEASTTLEVVILQGEIERSTRALFQSTMAIAGLEERP